MDDKLIFSKTPKGIGEVATRSSALSMAARRVLIMIDGRRSVGELAPLLRPGEIITVMATLEAQGFVVKAGGSDSSGSRPAAAEPSIEVNTVGGPPEERNVLTLDEAKRRAVRELIDRLGPEGEMMAMRIEQCRTAEDLRERLREAERLIGGLLGETAAQGYLQALRRQR
jgi:hypothetical protein